MFRSIKKITFFTFIISIVILSHADAQVGINTNGTNPDPSAILDVSSTEMGFLTPRMTSSQKSAIVSPATGLLIYQTNEDAGFYYNQGTPSQPDWVRLGNDTDIEDLQTRIPIDSVAFFDSYQGTHADYVITQSGSYYLTDIINLSTTGGNGIVIDADNVTLDMNGFAIFGDGNNNVNNGVTPGIGGVSDPGGSGSGILVSGEHFNITIKDGYLNSWQDDGIEAPDVKNSIFQNLSLRYNGQNGMHVGDQNLIDNCVSFFNVKDGIFAGVGNNLINCRGGENEESGIQADSSSQFISCTAFENVGEGITAGVGSLVLGCVVSDNESIGINASTDCSILKCSAYDNNDDGIRADENSVVRHCIVSFNDGSGIQLTGQSGAVIECTAHENDLNGIHCSNITQADIKVDGNSITDNDVAGLKMDAGGGLVIRNTAAGNATHYTLHVNTNHGPLVDVTGEGDISSVNNADHPMANFSY